MSTLTKVVSGNLYVEQFDMLNYLWEITPNVNSRVVLANGNVQLKHGNERVTMLTTAPEGDFVFQAKVFHEPMALSDIGGIVIMSDNNNMIECQTYYNSAMTLSQFYQYIKVIRERDLYTFYGSKDGLRWEVIGSSTLPDAHKIGFFLDGAYSTASKDFVIDNVAMYKSNFVTFVNAFAGMRVQILNAAKEVLASKTLEVFEDKAIVDLTDIPLPIFGGTIRLYDEESTLMVEQNIDIFGGDVFDYKLNLVITLDGTVIDPVAPVDLGHIGINGSEYLITIINKDNQIAQNRVLKVAEYSSFYRGGRFAMVSLEDSNGNPTTYSQSVNLPPILPNGVIQAWMKIDRDVSNEAPFFAKEYKYKIIIE